MSVSTHRTSCSAETPSGLVKRFLATGEPTERRLAALKTAFEMGVDFKSYRASLSTVAINHDEEDDIRMLALGGGF